MQRFRRYLLVLVSLTLVGLAACEGDTINEAPPTIYPDRIEISSGNEMVGVAGTRSQRPIAARVYLSDGTPAPGVKVVFVVEEGSATVEDDVVTTDANGVALTWLRFGTATGPVTVSATAEGLTGSPLMFSAVCVAADAAVLVPVEGGGQTGVVGQALPVPLTVRAQDSFGNPTAGVAVVFTNESGDGSLSQTDVQTDVDGLATTVWTLGTTSGLKRVTAAGEGLAGYPVVFTANAISDDPAELLVTKGDNQGGAVGQPLDIPLTVKVQDQYGNPVGGVMVGFAVTAGGGSVDPSEAETFSSGEASATLTLTASGDCDVTASFGALTPAVFHARAFTPITLDSPTRDISGVNLAWSANTNAGFAAYHVYRATTPSVTTDATLVATVTDEAQTTFADRTVSVGTMYYYRIFAEFDGGFRVGSNEEGIRAGLLASLAETGFDLAYDAVRDRIYVSLPNANAVAELDATSLVSTGSVVVGTRPYGISLAADGGHLYCALNTAGSVAAWQVGTANVEQIMIGTELGDPRTYDVLEASPDQVFVTSSPSSNGFAYVVKINIDFAGGHTAARVATNRIIRATPVLAADAAGTRVYVGEGFSPNSLYKLDATDPAAPIILEDQHGSVSGTNRLSVSPDGLRIYLRSGQVLQTADFNQIGSIGAGVPCVSGDGSLCYVGTSSELQVWRTDTYLQVGAVSLPFAADQMLLVPEKGYILVLGGAQVVAVPVP